MPTPPTKAKPDVELSEPLQHRNPKPAEPDQSGYDHHREREHDDLVDPCHDRAHRERELYLEQGLQGVDPNACAASTVSLGTCWMPSMVSRTAGGMAKTTVAMRAGGCRGPRRTTKGTR